MGSSGEKRKGRQHQPKVGTPAEDANAMRHERQAVEENFGIRPGGPVAWLFGAVIVIGAVIGVIALIAAN